MTSSSTDVPDRPPGSAQAPRSAEADYGPRGYLPERAAKRARKIILREQMGLQWPLAAAVAAVVVLVVGAVYLWTRTGPPGPPYVAAGAIAEVEPRGAATTTAGDLEVLVVRAGGGVRVFTGDVIDVTTCPATRRLTDAEGTVYSATGQALGRGESLQPVPSTVYDGVLYVAVDPAVWPPAPPTAAGGSVDMSC